MSISNVLEAKLICIFNEAQNGLQYHKKELRTLQDFFDSDSHTFNEFFDIFFKLTECLLVLLKREPATERLVDFIAKFAVSVAPKRSSAKENEEDSSSEEEEDVEEDKLLENFTHLFLIKLIGYSHAKEKAVRFRLAQIIAKIINYARDDPLVKIHYSILDEISQTLLNLLYDRFAIVRIQAALGLSYFQDFNDTECPITSTLAWSMENDSSAEVRRCIVQNLVLSTTTLGLVIGRTRDLSEGVRRSAFLVLSEKCTIRHLKIEQRIRLLRDGLQDRSEQVKEACLRGLLRKWLLTLDGDIHDLLRKLDLESATDVAEIVLMSLFQDFDDNELLKSFEGLTQTIANEETEGESAEKEEEASIESDEKPSNQEEVLHTIPLENLEPEVAFFWRCLCKHFKKKYDHTKDPKVLECLERVTPTLFNFCEYLNSCFQSVSLIPNSEESCESHMTTEFIMSELCGIISFLDFTDEVGRRQLGNLVYSLITSGRVPAGLVCPLLSEQRAIWPQESFRVEKMLEIIADVRYPSISESGTTSGESSLNNLSYLDLKEDTSSLLKCLSVATEMFGQLKMGKLSSSLQTLVESLLFPCIKNENPYVRDMAINALGRACLIDLELARTHILLFIQVSEVDHESVQATALKVVFDLLHLFGLSAFSQNEKDKQKEEEPQLPSSQPSEQGENESSQGTDDVFTNPMDPPSSPSPLSPSAETTKFLQILAKYLDEDSALLRGVAIEGLSKLLLSGRVISVKLLTRLFIIWYNPALQDDSHMRETLGVFFTEYSAAGHDCREAIAECFLPILKILFDAPPTSPLCTIDTNNLMSFILNLSSPGTLEDDSPHDSLAISIANHLLSGDDMSCDRTWCRMLCKSLGLMTFTKSNKSHMKDMLALLNQLHEEISDKQCLKVLNKLKLSLTILDSGTEDSNQDDLSKDGGGSSVMDEGAKDSEDDCEINNIENAPPTPPTNVSSLSVKKAVTTVKKKSVKRNTNRTAATSTRKSRRPKRVLSNSTNEDPNDSDDSVLGDHSPFIKPPPSNSSTRSATETTLTVTPLN